MMKRHIAAMALLWGAFSFSGPAFAQTAVQWGATKTANPWIVCLYDAANICQAVFNLPSTGGNAYVPPSHGGTGLISPTGYVYFNGSGAATASTTIPVANVTGLAPIATSGSASDLTSGTMPVARMPALTGGDATTSAGSGTITLNTVNANVGAFGSSTAIPTLTVNGKGLVTAASTNAVIAPAGTLTGTTLASNVVSSSLTAVGTIGTGTWQGTPITSTYLNHNGAETFSGTATFSVPPIFPASTTSAAGFNMTQGVAPSSPANGNTWLTSSGLFVQYNSATHQLASLDSPAFTGAPTAPTQGLGDNSTKLATTAFVANNAVSTVSPAFTGTPTAPTAVVGTNSTQIATTAFASSLLRGYLSGLTLSNDGTTPNTVLDISAGVAQGSDNATLISIGAFTKSIGGAWSAGTGQNGMGNGLTAAASTWYNVCLAYNAGSPDIYFDTSVTCANKPSGISGAVYRRVGAFETDSSTHILSFTQIGDEFRWGTPTADVNTTTLGTTATLFALNVPPGVVVRAEMRGYVNGSAGQAVLITSPFDAVQSTTSPSGNFTANVVTATTSEAIGEIAVPTNTSQQIRAVAASSSTTVHLNTFGWFDPRGRL